MRQQSDVILARTDCRDSTRSAGAARIFRPGRKAEGFENGIENKGLQIIMRCVGGAVAIHQPDSRPLRASGDRNRRGMRVRVTGQAGSIVLELKGTAGDKFEFKAPRSGMYKFCFNNPHSTPETVSFYIHVGHIPNEHDLAKHEHIDPINVKIAQLREALESVTAEQNYLKARDSRHRHTNESTRKRVIYYTIGEYILLAVASALQVFYIRKLFSKSVGYNRV
nr:transmembrane emp24 domain-containing protein p24beta3 [Ipomoea batatas]GMD80487.1 transmembrane emp24 domain-containing protein p24beta3 [Ipomoea batatas]